MTPGQMSRRSGICVSSLSSAPCRWPLPRRPRPGPGRTASAHLRPVVAPGRRPQHEGPGGCGEGARGRLGPQPSTERRNGVEGRVCPLVRAAVADLEARERSREIAARATGGASLVVPAGCHCPARGRVSPAPTLVSIWPRRWRDRARVGTPRAVPVQQASVSFSVTARIWSSSWDEPHVAGA